MGLDIFEGRGLDIFDTYGDDELSTLGLDRDIALLLRSTVLNANTALTSVLIGTPVAQAIAANSLMVSNITASGDIAFYVNKGGHSQMAIWLDGSSGDTAIMAASGASIDAYIAGTKVLDYASGAFAFQESVTISSTGTLTMGAFTAGGDITLGANKLKGSTLIFKELSGNWALRNTDDDGYAGLEVQYLSAYGGLILGSNGGMIRAINSDGGNALLQARDNGVGLVNIAYMQGGADPYFQIGRDDTGVGLSAVTDMLVLQAGGGTGNEAAGFGLGTSWKIGNAASEVEERGSLDLVLQTATNGSEDASWIWQAMVAGAMATVLSFGGYAGVAKLGFYATAPVALQTGVAVSAVGIHAALVNLGLITA